MLTEAEQDGHLMIYPLVKPQGRSKLLLHVNGVTSPAANQLRDLEALVWLTVEQPLDVMGIHNSTEGFRSDLIESLLGKGELFRFWPEQRNAESESRLQGYADLLQQLICLDLAADEDILKRLESLQTAIVSKPTPTQSTSATQSKLGSLPGALFDLDVVRNLPFVQKMGWQEFETYVYGVYPAGAPRPTLRLAYEILKGIRAGAEIFVVAHSQGMIIAALAFHILEKFFGLSTGWAKKLRFIGYGPVIIFADLPLCMRSQTVMIQHRQDLVAESLSNLRNVGFWGNLQNQIKSMFDNYDGLIRSLNNDSHHSASLYLGLLGPASGERSAQLIKLLLTQDWDHSPVIQSLRASHIIINEFAEELLTTS
jgi:hypothetical protein